MTSDSVREDGFRSDANHPILLFDGICNLCNGFVQFVLKRDGNELIRFGSLQSDAASKLLQQCDLPTNYTESLVLIEGRDCYTESSAVLRVCMHLGGMYQLLGVLGYIPKSVRDTVYRFIAEHRYDWFGERENCIVPDSSIQSRFIDSTEGESRGEP